MRVGFVVSIVISLAFAQCAHAGLISVSAAMSSSVDSGSAMATVNGAGLNDPVANAHTGANIQQLVLNGVSDPYAHYDFGSTQLLRSMTFWNYNDNGDGLLDRSIKDLSVYGSINALAFGDNAHASWVLLGSFNDMALHPRSGGGTVQDPYGSGYDLTDTTVRYVRFDIENTYGNQPAFAETQFFDVEVVPEPSSIALVGGALGLFLSRRRKRRQNR